MTQAQKVAKIWADWNERKIDPASAMYAIGKVFPIAVMREWRKRMAEIEQSHVDDPIPKKGEP